MSKLLKSGDVFGAVIGHKAVFTRQGAIDRYKLFLEDVYSNLTLGGAVALCEVEEDMIRAGFDRDELESIENEYLQSID